MYHIAKLSINKAPLTGENAASIMLILLVNMLILLVKDLTMTLSTLPCRTPFS